MSGAYFRPYEYDGKESRPYVFVSYSHSVSTFVVETLLCLHDAGYRIWYDEGIDPGSEWPANVERHLRRSACVLVFVSEKSRVSGNCENEINVALAEKKRILPVYLDGGPAHPKLPGLPAIRGEAMDAEALSHAIVAAGAFDDSFIGGEEAAKRRGRDVNVWYFLLGFCILVLLGVGVLAVGFGRGWFRQGLPQTEYSAADATLLTPTSVPEAAQRAEGVDADSAIGSAIMQELNRDDLLRKVTFSGEDDESLVRAALGLSVDAELTYQRLTECTELTLLDFSGTSLTDVRWAAYLPNLTELRLAHTNVRDLAYLASSVSLQTVTVSPDMPPLSTRNAAFDIVLVP